MIIYDKTDYTRSSAGAHVRDGRPASPVAARIPRGYDVERHRSLGAACPASMSWYKNHSPRKIQAGIRTRKTGKMYVRIREPG